MEKWKLLFNHKCIHNNPIICAIFSFHQNMHDSDVSERTIKSCQWFFYNDTYTY